MAEQNVFHLGHVICLVYAVHVCYGISSQEELLINSLKYQVDSLMNKFEMVVKENAALRDRVTALEQDQSVSLVKRRRRQSSTPWVAFSAYLDHQLIGLGKGQPITYNSILTNDGNGYNGSSGIFTAPVPGLYLFSWATTARRLSGQPAYDEWINLLVDGEHMLSSVAESRDAADDNQGSNTVVVRVNQGQQVWTTHNSGYDKIHGDDIERTTSFTGVLLYESE